MWFAVFIQKYIEPEYLETRWHVFMTGETRLIAAADKRIGQYNSFYDNVIDTAPYTVHIVSFTFEPFVKCMHSAETSKHTSVVLGKYHNCWDLIFISPFGPGNLVVDVCGAVLVHRVIGQVHKKISKIIRLRLYISFCCQSIKR